MINEFKGKYYFLSNFYSAPVMYEGLLYQNNEAAFQSAKIKDLDRRKQFCNLDPSTAKKKGRNVLLRNDWEDVKDEVMYQCVKDKFTRNQDLKQKLIDTGNEELIEGNTWNDTYWGVCRGRGKNMLGKILMRVRDEISLNIKNGNA
jgi:ribA/ribD-fused uncharacterized protein